MSADSPETKRRRVYESPSANIDSLPDAVLQVCFSFIGPSHFRYVAGTCRRFQEVYSSKHEKKTKWKAVAASIACAELCLDDVKEQQGDESGVLKPITFQAADSGRVGVLDWAHSNGYKFSIEHFKLAAFSGRVDVLQWLDNKTRTLGTDTDSVVGAAIFCRRIDVLEWLLHGAKRIDPLFATKRSAFLGEVSVLRWLKEQDLLCVSNKVWARAATEDHVHVLDWLWEEGNLPNDDAVLQGAARHDRRPIFMWARDHGVNCDFKACALATAFGNLPLLQWLRENDFTWDGIVLRVARREGYDHIVAWATENGCPEEVAALWYDYETDIEDV